MKAIVYTSNTGFTAQYAKLLSEKTGVPAYEWKEAKQAVPQGSDIFYMGWLSAGELQGVDAAMGRYAIRGAAIVGLSPRGNGSLWAESRIHDGYSEGGARLFYLQGGYAPEKLNWFQRFTMKQMRKSVEKQIQAKGSGATDLDRDMLALLRDGGSRVREESLEEIAAWFAQGPHEGVMKKVFTLDI